MNWKMSSLESRRMEQECSYVLGGIPSEVTNEYILRPRLLVIVKKVPRPNYYRLLTHAGHIESRGIENSSFSRLNSFPHVNSRLGVRNLNPPTNMAAAWKWSIEGREIDRCSEVATELMKDIGVTRHMASSDWLVYDGPYLRMNPSATVLDKNIIGLRNTPNRTNLVSNNTSIPNSRLLPG